MTFHDSLGVPANEVNGRYFQPLFPSSNQIFTYSEQPRGSGGFFPPPARQCGEKLDTSEHPNDGLWVFTIPSFCSNRSASSDHQRNNSGSIPKSHQPPRRSSNKSFSTLPRSFNSRRLSSHFFASPDPRQIRPLRSSRARRPASRDAMRDAFCRGMIWAMGWFRSTTSTISPLFT